MEIKTKDGMNGNTVRQNAIEKLRSFQGDKEQDYHIEADDILCELLEYLGYGDVVEEYNKLDKWYS